MKNGKLESQHSQNEKKHSLNKLQLLILSLLVVTTVTVGGTVAYLTTKTEPVTNTFTPSKVTGEVTEEFDGTVKKNIQVKNTGDIAVYVRVKLVTYRVNEKDEHIGGVAEIPTFNLGENWVEHNGYYYYTVPVEPNNFSSSLTDNAGITLKNYDDADGGKQVIEVMAEMIQSVPDTAVKDAWGVKISPNSVTSVK